MKEQLCRAFINPKSDARELSMGNADTVISACMGRASSERALIADHTTSDIVTHPSVCMLLHKVHVVHAVQMIACNYPTQCCVRKRRSRRNIGRGVPDKMTMWSMSLFFTSANSQEYCRTASAVP